VSRSNADRQRAYRERKRNACNAPLPQIVATKVTRSKDFYRDGEEYIFIGNFGYGDRYAKVVNRK
jgi:hypothetical protein